jgi:peptidoglycan/LPS O-acetylase OafA/YrhL
MGQGTPISGIEPLLPQKPKHYRPDIDGLRAIAVLAVVGFHGEISAFAGGFAGVDVFFVISGFLITGIILDSLEKNTFSFVEFYARRANRILPSLLLVIAATIAIGWCVLFTWESQALGRHVTASSLFVSNFLLWSEAGYFDSALKPLLHLWSLAVEEQFYLLWPIAAVAMWRRKIPFRWPVTAVVIASFAFSILALRTGYGTAAFYFPFSRFWEIGLGALLAIHLHQHDHSESPSSREIVALVGIVCLALTFFFVSSRTLWPGFWAIPPVAGTALLIWAGPATRINRLVGNKIFVAIGLVSYPLYLWHWPLMVMARLINEGQLARAGRVGLIVVSLVLAFITYRYVEIPIRFGARKRRSAALLASGLVVTGLVGIALATVMKPRLANVVLTKSGFWGANWTYPGGGFERFGTKLKQNTIRGDDSRTVVVLGDSHVDQYWPRFVELNRINRSSPTVAFITYEGCPLLPDTRRLGVDQAGSRYRCLEFSEKAFEIARRPQVRTVVFGAYWENYFKYRNVVYGKGSQTLSPTSPQTDSAFNDLGVLIKKLRAEDKRVFVILSNPVSPAFNPDSVFLPRRLPWLAPRRAVKAVSRRELEKGVQATNDRLRRITANTGAELIDPFEYLCTRTECPVVEPDGTPMYLDNNHLRAPFAMRLTMIDQIVTK